MLPRLCAGWLEGRVVGEARGWHTSMQRTLGEGPKLVCAIQERLAGPREATVLEDWVKLMWLGLEAMAWYGGAQRNTM